MTWDTQFNHVNGLVIFVELGLLAVVDDTTGTNQCCTLSIAPLLFECSSAWSIYKVNTIVNFALQLQIFKETL
jgi:hypothetical protein